MTRRYLKLAMLTTPVSYTHLDVYKRQGMEYVDLLQIHRWDYSTPIEETLEALNEVVKAGKARYIGASSMHALSLIHI